MPQPNDLRRSLLAGEARRLASSADTLSIVLAGHRKLKNDLRRPSIEEIGSRATIFDLEGSGREKRKFFVASLAEVAQRVQRAALHHRAHLLERLVW
jgi:type II secretory pathway predicted ATPase ExeA